MCCAPISGGRETQRGAEDGERKREGEKREREVENGGGRETDREWERECSTDNRKRDKCHDEMMTMPNLVFLFL